MITSLIAVLLLVAFLLLIVKRKKGGMLVLFVAVLSYFMVGSGLVPLVLLKLLQTPYLDLPPPAWKNQNAIVLLGAGTVKVALTGQINPMITAYTRINKAASLYLSCVKEHKCTIVISGGDALGTGQSEAYVYREALIQLGVSRSDIILEDRSMNTYQNAEYSSAILKQGQYNYIVLVSSGTHLKRSLCYFSHFGIDAKPVFSDYLAPIVSKLPLGYNFAMTDLAIHEYRGIAQFYIYQFFGWNKQ